MALKGLPLSGFLITFKIEHKWLNLIQQDLDFLKFYVECHKVLGPPLFLIYINYLPSALDIINILFADDTTFVVSGGNINDLYKKQTLN